MNSPVAIRDGWYYDYITCFNKFLTNSLLLSVSVIFFVYEIFRKKPKKKLISGCDKMGVVKFPLNFRPPPLYNAASAPAFNVSEFSFNCYFFWKKLLFYDCMIISNCWYRPLTHNILTWANTFFAAHSSIGITLYSGFLEVSAVFNSVVCQWLL